MKIGFFRALLGSCAGYASFDRLRQQNLWRSLWHLLVMALLASVIMFAGEYPSVHKLALASAKVFAENCGALRCSNQGVYPVENPEKTRIFMIAGPMSVTYLPEEVKELPESFHQDCSDGVIWSGRQLAVWKRDGAGGFLVQTMNKSMQMSFAGKVYSPGEILAKLRSSGPLQLNLPPDKSEVLTPENIKLLLETLLPMGLILWFLKKSLLDVLLYIAMFTGVFALMNIRRSKRFKVKEMAVMAIYAGFPPMLIGSIAEALGLFDFNIIYVLGMTFYLIFIMGRLERERQLREWHELDKQ